MVKIGTALTTNSTKIMLLGSGELGKEVLIELQRYGAEVIAVDRYKDAPAMQVAHRSHVINMLSADELRRLIELEKPNIIVPEIEAIATEVLLEFEKKGVKVIPNANAVHITMNRERIRNLVSNELKIPTTKFRFANNLEQLIYFVESDIGYPCVVKPIMSSSGKGQSLINTSKDISNAWDFAQETGRAGKGRVIVEEYLDFDFEITLLTVKSKGLISFCPPIGHKQKDGDYIESWQPQLMSEETLKKSQKIAEKVVNKLSGSGVFGVELFIKNNIPFFSEVSPRPHDTGLVTLISQDLSEFELHARAVLGLPIPKIHHHGPSASAALVAGGDSRQIKYNNLEVALSQPDTNLLLFGKPDISGHRRLGVAIARGSDIDIARAKAVTAIESIHIEL